MVAELEARKRRKRDLEQATTWMNPRLGMKARMRRIREANQRMSESRIIEDALLMYLPILERQLLPMQDEPTRRNSSAA